MILHRHTPRGRAGGGEGRMTIAAGFTTKGECYPQMKLDGQNMCVCVCVCVYVRPCVYVRAGFRRMQKLDLRKLNFSETKPPSSPSSAASSGGTHQSRRDRSRTELAHLCPFYYVDTAHVEARALL